MKESKTYGDRQLIFRETFADEQSVRANGGVPSGVTFNNGVATFNGSTSKIVYPTVSGVLSVRLILTPGTTTQNILKLSSTHSISVSAGTVAGTGFASPTIYVNGVAGSTITATKVEVVITTATAIRAKDIQLGYISTYLTGTVELMECYNTVLSANDVKNLYEGKRLKAPKLDKDEQLGPEMVVNGGFSTDTGWDKSGSSWTINNGTANYDKLNVHYINPTIGVPFTAGKRYRFTYTISGLSSGTAGFNIVNSSAASFTDTYSASTTRANGTYSEIVLCTVTSTNFRLYGYMTSTSAWSIDNLSIKEVLVESTRVIADINVNSGAIANRLSGDTYNELVTNGDFSSATGWALNGTGVSISGGVGIFNNSGSGSNIQPALSTILGKTYRITYKVTSISLGAVRCVCGTGANGIERSVVGTYTQDLVCTTDTNFYIRAAGTTTATIDNVSVKEVIPTVVNTAMAVSKQNDGYAMLFNGTTSKVDCGSYDTLVGDKSVIAWVNAKTWGKSNVGKILFNTKLNLSINLSLKDILFSSDGTVTYAHSASNISLKTPIQIIVTRTTAGIANIYINGILSNTANQSSGIPVAGTTNILIGDNDAATRTFDGLISNVRIIDGILTAPEIAQIYTSEKNKYLL